MSRTPHIGFISLGCPKALVDTERIVTQLRAEGYLISGSYEGADIVIVNTCGFIDAAIEESLGAISEALTENGKVIVTGCLGGKEVEGKNFLAEKFPALLGVTGPEETEAVLNLVHEHLPRPHEPFGEFGSCRRYSADPAALCLFKNLGRLQSPLYFLHHSVFKRTVGFPSDRFCYEGSE